MKITMTAFGGQNGSMVKDGVGRLVLIAETESESKNLKAIGEHIVRCNDDFLGDFCRGLAVKHESKREDSMLAAIANRGKAK